MALMVIVGMWLAVGMVALARRRAERGSTSSIGEFRRQLRIIGRTGPDLMVTPANRLRVPRPNATVVTFPDPVARRSTSSGPAQPSTWGDAPGTRRRPAAPRRISGRMPGHPTSGRSPHSIPRSAAGPGSVGVVPDRRRTLERRRNVLVALATLTVGAAVIGAVPGARMMWFLAGTGAISLATYVGLLVRIRSAAAQRELELRIQAPPRRLAPEPMLRRSATN